jgi:hypothetical protein
MIANLRIHIKISIVDDSITGLHPLNPSRINFSIISLAVKMLFLTVQDIGQGCNAPVWVGTITIFLNRFSRVMLRRSDMIQEYKGTYCIGVAVGQNPLDFERTDIGALALGRETYFLFHDLFFFK